MATFVIVHGAWSGEHAWRWMRPLLRSGSHEAFTPALTGLGRAQRTRDGAAGTRQRVGPARGAWFSGEPGPRGPRVAYRPAGRREQRTGVAAVVTFLRASGV